MARTVLSPYLPPAPLNADQRALFEQYKLLAYKRAHAAQRRYAVDPLLLKNAALIGLMCAAERYVTPSSASFLTFATHTIDWTIRFLVMHESGLKQRKNKPRKRPDFEPSAYRASGDMPDAFWDAESEEPVLVDSHTPEELVEIAERQEAAQRIIAKLEGKVGARSIAILRRHLAGEPLARIAPDFGVSRERVRQIVVKTLKRARTMLAAA
jgi:RNA polymerase sigma factor (sigma-70 family)